METSEFQAIIKKSNNILIITPPNSSDDILTCAFALELYLQKLQKKVAILRKEKTPQRLTFLKQPSKTISSLSGLRDFVLVFDTKRNKIVDMHAEQKDGRYIVRITPEKGSIDPRDFSFMPADFKHDLLIILGCPNLDCLGPIYEENTDLFFEVPKINIDNQSTNENYAQVNVVDMTASSISEICANLILDKEQTEIEQELAQALLTGIIAATESFQKPTTTPKAMIMAAKLMKFKADQPTIIRHLYKTKSLSFLKLWGRVMARLNWNEEIKCAWSLISAEDFVQSRASKEDISYVLEEIQKNFSQGHIFAIFHSESSGKIHGKFLFSDKTKARELSNSYEVSLNNGAFSVELETKDLLKAEKDFLEKIKSLE
jgi:nanoRNase/pAp phosphatase (c-di-AMP/oligoRNAs hydrolase)